MRAVFFVVVKRFAVLPKAHALRDIVQESLFVDRGSSFSERRAQSRPREGVRQRSMTRHAEGLVIAGSRGPCGPPAFPLVEVTSCGFPMPGAGGFGFTGRTGRNQACQKASRQDTFSKHCRLHGDRLRLELPDS